MSTAEGPGEPVIGATTREDRNWAMAAHVSALVGAWVWLGFIGPLAVLLLQGTRSPVVRAHAVEALNFNLSLLIYGVIAWLLVFLVIGIPLVVAGYIVWLVCTILATVKASNGEFYKYPLTIRMVH